LDNELATHHDRISKMSDGPGKTALKERVAKLSQRREMCGRHRDHLQSSCLSMEQAATTMETLQNLMTITDAMKSANKEMRRLYGKIDPNEVERYYPS
jgi:charged multivesicular body protein 5